MIYADYNSTTPCLPEVADLMQRVLLGDFGNPSQLASSFGRRARAHLDTARARVAESLGAFEDEITFTSGATEACNTAILGVMERLVRSRPKLLTSAIEHSAVRMTAEYCQSAGADWQEIPVDAQGRVNMSLFRNMVDEKTGLVCIMAVNNETGVIQDIPTLARICHEKGALLFCDMTQALGKMQVDAHTWQVDLAAVSAHKCYGPKGVGALYKRRGLAISPLLRGGGQEAGLRSGTENVPGIAGFGLAAELAHRNLTKRRKHLRELSDLLETLVTEGSPQVIVQSKDAERVPGTSMFSHPTLPGNWLPQLSDVVATAGSACASASDTPSHVLTEMGWPAGVASRSVRISLGVDSNESEVRHIAHRLVEGAKRMMQNDA